MQNVIEQHSPSAPLDQNARDRMEKARERYMQMGEQRASRRAEMEKLKNKRQEEAATMRSDIDEIKTRSRLQKLVIKAEKKDAMLRVHSNKFVRDPKKAAQVQRSNFTQLKHAAGRSAKPLESEALQRRRQRRLDAEHPGSASSSPPASPTGSPNSSFKKKKARPTMDSPGREDVPRESEADFDKALGEAPAEA